MKISILLLTVSINMFFNASSSTAQEKTIEISNKKGPYLGQKPPRLKPELFGEKILSSNHYENSITFSPNGEEIYFARGDFRPKVIMYLKLIDNKWTTPEIAEFSGKYQDGYPCFSPDGKKLFFASYRPVRKNGEERKDWDIWMVNRTNNGWSDPYHLGDLINTDNSENSPSVTKDGTLYFVRKKVGNANIYRSQYSGSEFSKPVKIGIDSDYYNSYSYIASDDSYILFSSYKRNDGFGEADIYISFKVENGEWTEAVNLGAKINSYAHENCAILSPDGKYLFFTSYKSSNPEMKPDINNKIILNGFPNFYWVDAKVIEELRETVLREDK